MDRHNDIRNLMNLMESAIAPVVEANAAPFDMASFMDQVLALAKKTIDEGGHNASSSVESVRDVISEKLFAYGENDTYEAARKAGWPTHLKEYSFINKAFREKFGKSMEDYAYAVEDKAYARDARSIKPEDKAIFKLLSDKLTVKATPKWAAEYLMWYKYSATKIVVQDEGNLPEAMFGPIAFKQLGITMADFAAWLEAHGIKQMKKPKRYKSPPPMYD
jgi:hypothetical protein